MHLPRRWSKSNRISRLVANPNPLLVETGFPASLLDLFFKNHHRFNTPKPKPKPKPNANNNHIKPDTLPPPSVATIQDRACNQEAMSPLIPSAIVAAVLMVFLVAALAFGTKKLAFGITISAFLLLTLEYASRYVPCAKQKPVFDSGPLLLSTALGIEHPSQDSPNISTNFNCVQTSDDDWGVCTSSGEIELVEPKLNVNQVSNCHHISGPLDDHTPQKGNAMEEKMSSREEDLTGTGTLVSGIKKRRSRSARLKSRIIHKLVPKKLRHSRKDENCNGSDAKFEDQSTSVKEGGSIGILSRQEEKVSLISELETESEEHKSTYFQVGPAKVDDLKQGDLSLPSHHTLNHAMRRETDSGIFGSGHSYALVKRSGIQNKLATSNIQIDARGKSGYVMLFVIVLAGLVGGRILSFLLAIGYFCILKSICTLRRKDSIIPIFASSVQR